MAEQHESTDEQFPPGTVLLERILDRKHAEIILHPRPTADPNDPLNWSKGYKIWNFTLVCFYTLMVFVNLDIGTVVWGDTMTDLGYTIQQNTWGFGLNTLGLAFGCILFIPFALKYGRRPVYIISAAVDLATAIWQARMRTAGDLYGSNLLSGLAGAISETICQMTIADVFFVHQRGTANGVFLVMVNIGAFLAPVAAGYSADSQGWRWIFWWTTILFAICLVVFIFGYEDTKYVPAAHGTVAMAVEDGSDVDKSSGKIGDNVESVGVPASPQKSAAANILRKTYWQRLAFTTTSPGNWSTFLRHSYQPFIILFTFPAFTYAAIIYGSLLAWFSVVVSVYSSYFTLPPYNFSAVNVGLMNLAPFIGSLVGSVYGGLLSDWLIVRLSRRNKGVFEPEMRLWLALPAVFITPGSILFFGLPMAKGLPWIVPALGAGFFGFGFGSMADIALTYTMDCYQEIVGDGFAAVCFVRNACATVVAFLLTDWVNGVGLEALFWTCAGLALLLGGTTFPMMIWGKRFRIMTAKRLKIMAARQYGSRTT